jgi:hypothetical protein
MTGDLELVSTSTRRTLEKEKKKDNPFTYSTSWSIANPEIPTQAPLQDLRSLMRKDNCV